MAYVITISPTDPTSSQAPTRLRVDRVSDAFEQYEIVCQMAAPGNKVTLEHEVQQPDAQNPLIFPLDCYWPGANS